MITFLNDTLNDAGKYHIRHNAPNFDIDVTKYYIASTLALYGLSVNVVKVIGLYAEVEIKE